MPDLDAVLLDSDAFSVLFVPRRNPDPRRDTWRELMRHRRPVISFVSRGQLLGGAGGWGEQRQQRLRDQLDDTPTFAAEYDVIDAYAQVSAQARAAGHGIHQAVHAEDRWIAACAIAKDLPLPSGDHIFRDVPQLDLLVDPGVSP